MNKQNVATCLSKIGFERKAKLVLLLIASFLLFNSALANPVIDNIAAGEVSVQQTPNTTTINQSSQKAIINWQSFNIGAQESTHFAQPAGGIALNRINATQGASQIYGHLTATGQIILINPAGIYFGPSAYVNVGGIIATTANMTDQNFMKGIYQFDKVPGFSGSVINDGQIIAAEHGLVALVAPGVMNNGMIQANVGHVVLASGDAFTMNFSGDDMINFKISAKTSSPGIDQNGNPLAAGVSNAGSVFSNGGKVLVTAQAVAGVLDKSIDMRGTVEARSVYQQNGSIIISGDPNSGKVRVASTINASGNQAGQTGGKVIITGYDVSIDAPTLINASGDAGGGFVETSGKYLTINDVNVNTSAAHGTTGTWLLDPTDFTIGGSTSNVTQTGGTFVGDNNASTSSISVATLLSQLNTSNVIIETTGGGTGSGAGNITVASNVQWTTANSLTLSAYKNILINSGVTIGSSNASGSLNLISNNAGAFDIGSGGGLVTNSGTISSAAPVNIYYNPASTSYTPNVYTNTGAGAVTGYMYVNNAAALQTISTTSAIWANNYALSQNIDAGSLVGLTPIGTAGTNFSGKFNGLGHIINNIAMTSVTSGLGLFGITNSSAVISNMGVSGTVSGTSNVGLLVGSHAGTISNVFSAGLVTGTGSNVGGLVGTNSGTITNVESRAGVSATGATNVGGVAGSNSGTLTNALATGAVVGTTSVGGLVGNNSSLVVGGLWNTDTTGLSSGVGTNSGTFTATGGCFSGTCTNGGTVNLSSASAYSNAGWDMTNNWGIIAGQSYAYLLGIYGSTPRAISGQINQFTSYYDNAAWATHTYQSPLWSSLTPYAIGNQQVGLAKNGVVMDNTYSGANGAFYFLEGNGTIADGAAMLAYLANSGNKGNTVLLAPTSNASVTDVPIALNTVLATSNGQLTDAIFELLFFNSYSLADIAASDLANAVGSLSNANILYSATSTNININSGFNFVTAPTTKFILDENLITTNGSITLNGDTQVGFLAAGMGGNVTLQTSGNGNIYLNNTYWPMSVTDFSDTDTLNITAANNIFINGVLADYSFLGGSLGTVNLSAAYTDQSITTGPVTSSNIQVYTFNLNRGKWYQNFAASRQYSLILGIVATDYPALWITSFNIDSGTLPSPNVEFIRVGGGNGSPGNPYIIFDVFGLEGIGSNDTTLAASYQLGANWGTFLEGMFGVAVGLDVWHQGAGFLPIGNLSHPFTGRFDGNNQDPNATGIFGTSMYLPNTDNVGLFGVTSPTAVISNILMQMNNFTGRNNVGMLVGINNGTIDNAYIQMNFIIGNNNVGSLAGINNGTITNSSVMQNRLIGNDKVGGTVGVNNGLIDKALGANIVVGNTHTGGIAGTNTGTIRNSFWDTDVSGQTVAAGLNTGTLDHVTGGCLLGTCSNGGIASLSNRNTYLSVADGGTGYVSSSWDFTNIWSILPETPTLYSYPYHQFVFNPAGATPTVYSGTTNAVNQVLLMSWLIDVNPNLNTITGADGSFYFIAPSGDNVQHLTGNDGLSTVIGITVVDNSFVVFSFVGGNTTGLLGIEATGDPITRIVPGLAHLTVPTTFTSGPSYSNQSYNYIQLFGLATGASIQDVLAKGYSFYFATNFVGVTSAFTTSLQDIKLQLNNNQGYNTLGLINAALYNQYQQEGEDLMDVNDNLASTDDNVKTILADAQTDDKTVMQNTEVTPIQPAYCGK